MSFSAEKAKAFYELEEDWFKCNITVEYWKNQVLGGISRNGWVRSEVFEETVEKNRALRKEWYDMAEDDNDRALVEQSWLFDDREEVE